MVTIKCKHSGIVFEAKTKRTKQHPDIAALKQRANKDGNYREVDNALDAVTKAGGYSTIEKYMQLVNDMVAKAIDAKRQASNKLAAERRAEQTRRHDAKKQRDHDNSRLRKAGYKWRRFEFVEGDYEYDYMDKDYEWWLEAPDGKSIEKSTAMQIIDGEMTLEQYRKTEAIELAKAQEEYKKARAEEIKAQELANQAKIAELEAERKEHTAIVATATDGENYELELFRRADGNGYNIGQLIRYENTDASAHIFSAVFAPEHEMTRLETLATSHNVILSINDKIARLQLPIAPTRRVKVAQPLQRLDGMDDLPEEELAKLGL